jgi:hypothetical protein
MFAAFGAAVMAAAAVAMVTVSIFVRSMIVVAGGARGGVFGFEAEFAFSFLCARCVGIRSL